MAGKETSDKFKKMGLKVIDDIEKRQNPNIDIPIRALSNIVYDKKTGQLTLGNKSAKRYFFNVAHSKKFMQTLMVAAYSKHLIDQNAHNSIRDMYYALKRTLPDTNENTFDEQNESVCPDEPLLVRINGELKIIPGSEVVDFAEKTGKVIFDENGKKRISDVDLYVCAFNENQEIDEHKVKLVIKHPTNNVKKIKTASGRDVKVTQSHSLFTIKDGDLKDIKTNELKAGDWIALPRNIKIKVNGNSINIVEKLIQNAPEEVINNIYLKSDRETIENILKCIGKDKLKELTSNYKDVWSNVTSNWRTWCTIPLSIVKKGSINLDKFLPELKIGCRGSKHYYKTLIQKNEYLGTVLGYLLSEGSHSIFKKRSSRDISISNSNIDLLKDFERSFENTFGEKCAGNIFLGKDGIYKLNVGYDTLSYILSYAIGYKPVRAWDKEIPSLLLDAPDFCIKAFLRSFRLGDGSSYKPKFRIRYHTTSQKIVNGLVFLLLRLGIFSRIYRYKPRGKNHHEAFEVRIGNRESVELLSEITKDFEGLEIKRRHEISSDKIPFIHTLLEEARGSCKKRGVWKDFNWDNLNDRTGVGRSTLKKITQILKDHETDQRYISKLEQIINSHIYWDKIISIETAEPPEYTLDLAVNPTQNFIGGNGFVILHNSDPIIVDVEVALDILREQMNLTTDRKGIVAGNVIIRDRGDSIDWSKLGSGGWSIPSTVGEIDFKKVDANFVIVVEKNAGFERLHEDKFWQKQNCVLIGTGGQPSRGTRLLIQRLNQEHKLPVYVMTDIDSYGLYIYSVIKSGSMSLAHISERIATPQAKFIGLTMTDIYDYDLKKCTIKAKEVDIKRAKELLNYEWFKKNPRWVKEINLMIEKGVKAEIEALSNKGLRFISEQYLPEKLKKKDFID